MTEQSPAAICYAFEDAQADIIELAEQLERMKLLLSRIAYPARNSPDDFADLNMFAAEIQATWSMEDLEANVQGDGSPSQDSNEASDELTAEQILGNLHFLAMFEGCPDLRLSLGESDIGRRLLSSLDLWLKLRRPDPVFGLIHGPRHEWVPKFESWIQAWALKYSDFLNERPR